MNGESAEAGPSSHRAPGASERGAPRTPSTPRTPRAHLSLLQQPAQRALADDVAPAQKQDDPEGQHHQQQQAAHDAGGDGRDPGPGTRRRHTGGSDFTVRISQSSRRV